MNWWSGLNREIFLTDFARKFAFDVVGPMVEWEEGVVTKAGATSPGHDGEGWNARGKSGTNSEFQTRRQISHETLTKIVIYFALSS